MEVFDPKTQTWEPVLCRLPVLCPLLANIRNNIKLNSTVIEGRIYYMFESTTLAYHPKEDKWEAIRERMGGLGSCCVIDKVLYCGSVSQGLKWYDTKKHNWVNIKGLEVLPKFTSYDSVKLADYGGTLAVFSKNMYYVSKETRVWCAVIVFERRGNDEIWGTVEWFDTVLTVPNFYSLVCAL
ncbi:unnamed protein product [Thlaspi arvense]|uniref:FKB95-like N-terminal Kelch domain-containing protein n=1 Tax=Thlaspi arvense TaxID=13288 RepID=A0AAU9T6U0_THLAR|nr:unnamed protein product [Thlaspi arvense]